MRVAAAKIMRSLWVAYFYVVFATGVIILFPFFWWGMRRPSRFPRVHRIRSYGCSVVLWLTGVRLKIIKEEGFTWPDQAILIANHTSIFDIVAGATLLREELLFLGKAELKKVPLLGYFFRHMDIPVDRHSKEGARQAYELAGRHLDRGANLMVFPEATTSRIAPQLLKFKKGAFKMAVQHQIPVVPVTFVDNWWRYHYDTPWDGRPGTLRIVLHRPLWPEGNSPAAVHQMMTKSYAVLDDTLQGYFSDSAEATKK